MPKPLAPGSRILIVGGGEFGLSTALSLAEGPYSHCPHLITVVDRSPNPPSIDAASSDINKIVRSDYASVFDAKLASRAMSVWKSARYSQFYHESGTIVATDPRNSGNVDYVMKSFSQNTAAALGLAKEEMGAVKINGADDMRSKFGPGVEIGKFVDDVGYFNPRGGWANARGVMEEVCRLVRAAGVTFEVGEVTSLIYDEGKTDVRGVAMQDGRQLMADLVVLAAGSWTATLLPELGDQFVASGQAIGAIQLTQEEADLYRGGKDCMGRPNHDNLFKFAIHGPGYLNPREFGSHVVSVPRTTLSPGCEGDQIPKDGFEDLKTCLARVYPRLADKPWLFSRLCWYTDTPSSQWVLDYHPEYPSLFLATGGNGQAFKFLTIIGELITGALYGTLDAEQKATWGWENLTNREQQEVRIAAGAKILRTEDMMSKEDL